MSRPKKILLLGASGFVGDEVLRAFTEDRAQFELYALQNRTTVNDHPDVRRVQGSLFDAPGLIKELNPDLIVHAARISGKRYRFLGRRKAAFLGRVANGRILKAIRQQDTRLVYVSGSLMYGSHPGKEVDEDFPVNPISYAIDYVKAERPFQQNLRQNPVIMCRPGWIFGHDSWFKAFFEDVIKKEGFVPQYGDGRNFMSIIHKSDLGRLIKAYALQAPASRAYNLYSPIGLSHRQFVEELAAYYNKEIKIIPKEELTRRYGAIVSDALTCDIRLVSKYTSIIENFDFQYRSVRDLLES